MPLTATPPRPHPRRRPRPSLTLTPSSASPSPSSSQAHGARGRAAPDLAGCPDPGPRARVAAASRPRAVHTPCAPARRGLSRPHAGSALRACDPCYGKAAWATRWHWVGERWRLAVTTGCAGVLDATPHARGRVPARHAPSAVGEPTSHHQHLPNTVPCNALSASSHTTHMPQHATNSTAESV